MEIKKVTFSTIIFITFLIFTQMNVLGQYSSLVYPGSDGKLEYKADSMGNRIPDYSIAGYKGGGLAIPNVPVVKTLEPEDGDDTQRIKDAIEWVKSNVPLNAYDIRGAILLKKGVYEVSSRISIDASGIVIRGEGNCRGGTIIKHIGNTTGSTFFIGKGGGSAPYTTDIDQDFVPVGATTFKVKNTSTISQGQELIIKVAQSQKWIDDLKLSSYWKKEDFILSWKRIVKAVDHTNKTITIDGGITSQIDLGGGYAESAQVFIYSNGSTRNIGVEDLILMSDYDRNVKDANGWFVDENHATVGIYFSNGLDNWARRVTGFFYKFALIQTYSGAYNITVEDCAMIDGVSKDNMQTHAGTRDYYFCLSGSSTLVQRCYGRNGRHTFEMNGPNSSNVFLDCYAEKEHLSSEPHLRWEHGSMYDNVRTDAEFKLNRSEGDHGQRTANCMLWNITSDNKRYFEPDIYLDNPPKNLAQQWAIGIINNGTGKGISTPSPESTYGEAAFVESVGSFVEPRSLYLAQLKDRMGEAAVESIISPEQKISCHAVWDKMIEKYQSIPEFGDPDDLSWLPACENITTAVDVSKESEETYELYPNPASGTLNMVLKKPEKTTVNFYSINGSRVKTAVLESTNSSIDINDLVGGIYLMEIKSKTINTIEKLVISR